MYIAQKDMDRDLPFRRQYAYDSDDEGPVEQLDGGMRMTASRWIHKGGKPNPL